MYQYVLVRFVSLSSSIHTACSQQWCLLLAEAGALVVGDGMVGFQALQVLGQAVVLLLQLHQLSLPPHPPPLQLPPLLPFPLDLPCQVVHHCLQRPYKNQVM